MKKTLAFFGGLLALSAGTAQAQITNDRGTFTKPTAGEWSIETQLAPNIVGGSVISLNDPFLQTIFNGIDQSAVRSGLGSYSGSVPGRLSPTLPMLRFRKFSSETMAHRFLVNLSMGSSTDKDVVTDPAGNKDITVKSSQRGIALGYGIEKHLTGAERLSTYVGGDVMVGTARYAASAEFSDDDPKVSQGAFGVSLRGFTGMDYYIVPKVYLGLELGMGLGFSSVGATKAEGKLAGADLKDADNKSSDVLLTPYIMPSFRLGYRL